MVEANVCGPQDRDQPEGCFWPKAKADKRWPMGRSRKRNSLCIGGVALVGRKPVFSPRCHLVSPVPAAGRLRVSCSKHGFVVCAGYTVKQLLMPRGSQ